MNQQNNEDINISELIAKCYKFLVNNKFIITFCFVLFAGIGFFRSGKTNTLSAETLYTKELIGIAPAIPDKILLSIINNVKTILNNGSDEDVEQLATSLHTQSEVLLSIKDIVINETFRDDLNRQGINISLTLNDEANFSNIISGLQEYVSTNPYVIAKQNEYIQKKQNYLELINERINELSIKGKKTVVLAEDVSMIFLLHKEKQSTEFELNAAKQIFEFVNLNTPIITLTDKNPKTSAKLKIIEFGVLGIIIGIILATIPVFITSIKKYL